MLHRTLLNISNKISFDWYGDRSNATYEIVNVQLNSTKSKSLVTVGQINDNVNIILNETNIRWLGNETSKPSGSFISNHLKVSTVFLIKNVSLTRMQERFIHEEEKTIRIYIIYIYICIYIYETYETIFLQILA